MHGTELPLWIVKSAELIPTYTEYSKEKRHRKRVGRTISRNSAKILPEGKRC